MPAKTITALICITILLAIALFKNIDGILLTSGCVLLAGLGGYAKGKSSTEKKNDTEPPIPPAT